MVGRSRRRGAAKWATVRANSGPDPAGEKEDDSELPPSPGDSSYYQDQVDDFHEARSRAALTKGWHEVGSGDEEEDGDEEEEVLGLDGDDEDDEDGESVGEEDGDDDDSSMQSETEASVDPSLSWGQRKKLYYDTDYGPKSRGRKSQDLEEEEREEEEEAQLIQERLTQALQEDDFGVTWVEAFAKPVPQVDGVGTRVVKDLTKVSVKEKLKMLRKEAPELLELIEDLKARLAEMKYELEPLLQMVEQGLIPSRKGSQYLRTKYNLYLNYCSNISFYLILKARRTPVHEHPVLERLATYRNLINKLASVDQRLSSEIRHLLKLKDGTGKKELHLKVKSLMAKLKSAPKALAAVSAVTDVSSDSDVDETALKYYKEMEDRENLKRKKEESATEQALEDPKAKRAITYQIAKNRGLTPRRKKIDRNPRVKHREKFRRAKIRRRGQVREVRREEQRYSGELSGIRAGVKKSIKLK
ncbi:something about silencing protein 10 [Tenrec ecaudatus]|uniref:something about silencing protein 10 n=1 Tax=Tenrec ecaudatus TaxID=94439 RepID=UPI003F5AA71A